MTSENVHRAFRLVPCDRDGAPEAPLTDLPEAIRRNCQATAEMYRQLGYVPPWVGYISVDGGTAVGGGAFLGPPADNRVEIAYYTLEEYQGRGYARLTAWRLVRIAREAAPGIALFAKTLPEHNASTAVLTRLGFRHAGSTDDHEIGEAWAWLLEP